MPKDAGGSDATPGRRLTILSILSMAERGGSDHAFLRMIRTLPPEEFDCHVVAPAEPPLRRELETAGATVHVVRLRRLTGSGGLGYWVAYALAWPVAVVRLARLARRVRADVIHTNSLHSLYGWAAALLVRRPHVWHDREIVVQSRAALRLARFLARRSAAVVAISQAVADALDVPGTRVILDDVDAEEFGPHRAGRFRGIAGIGDGVPLVGFVGRLDVWKGLDVVLDALPAVRQAVPDAELVVAGPTVADKEDYAEGLRQRARHVGGVHWLGTRDDVPALVADLDVLASPSTHPEPFGLVLVEALASGVPVVATNAGGPVEIAARAEPGAVHLVPPGDAGALAAALVGLLTAPTARPRTGRPRLWQPRRPPFEEVFRQAARR